MTNDIRDRMGGLKLTRGSLVIAVERWLRDLAVDYAKMDEASRHKEAEIYVDEFLATLSPCARGGEEPLATGLGRLIQGGVASRHLDIQSLCWTQGGMDVGEWRPVRFLVFDLPGGKPCS